MMKKGITRRDFLKLTGLLPLSFAGPEILNTLEPLQQANKKQNVLIIVFDALSAKNISLYGYPRDTMPNLNKLADRAIVYHNHYAGGNFTSPGTASLLTGTLPWTNRAFRTNGIVKESISNRNIFTAFNDYYSIAYTHNPWADSLLVSFSDYLNDYVRRERNLLTSDGFITRLFKKDQDLAIVSWIRAMKSKYEGYSYSLFLSQLYKYYREEQIKNLVHDFPRGVPGYNVDNYFLLEDAINWLSIETQKLPQPFLGYFHFYPPHEPYNTHQDFFGHFKNDGWFPMPKPKELFAKGISDARMQKYRMEYDEFILYVDREFGRLFDHLAQSGFLENTWVVFTSDHGEMLERGIIDHITPVLYEPVIKIPLLIFEPGRTSRTNVYQKTSAIDVLPTLLHVTEQKQAKWNEGIILPPFRNEDASFERGVYVLEAKENETNAPLTIATIALLKEQYKLMYFIGHEELDGEERIELYDLKNDPEELNDLSISKRETTAEMLHEIKQKLAEVNEPYL